MKKIFYSFIITILALGMAACEQEKMPTDGNKTTGQIDLSSLVVSYDETTILRSVDVNDFIVTIQDETTHTLHGEWKYKELPEILTLTAGNYSIKVESHKLQDVAWDTPYYCAEKAFKVEVDKVTLIGEMVCVMSNVKVTVEFAPDLMAIMGDDCKVNIGLGRGTLDFTRDEARAGYFAVTAEENRLYSYFTGSVDGYVDTIYREIENVKAGEWRVLRYSLKQNTEENKETGSFSPSIVVNLNCSVIEQGEQIDVNEDVIKDPEPPMEDPDVPGPGPGEEPKGPVISAEGFDIDDPQTIYNGMTLVIDITSESPIATFTVDINSETLTADVLTSVGLGTHLDLVNPGTMKEGLQGLQFPVEDQVKGQHNVKFDITQFCPLLGIYGAATHEFIMTVADEAGNSTTKVLTLITE